MKCSSEEHHRRSIRLKDYDYSQIGAYFVTIGTYNKDCVLGKMNNTEVQLSSVGKIAIKFWLEIPKHFDHVQLDEFVLMPNHIHGIIIIREVGVQNFEPLQKRNRFQKITPRSIGSIIRAYKSSVKHWCKENDYESFKWQRNYYEHVIRNEDDLRRIREYIVNNPLIWELDSENPENIKSKKLIV